MLQELLLSNKVKWNNKEKQNNKDQWNEKHKQDNKEERNENHKQNEKTNRSLTTKRSETTNWSKTTNWSEIIKCDAKNKNNLLYVIPQKSDGHQKILKGGFSRNRESFFAVFTNPTKIRDERNREMEIGSQFDESPEAARRGHERYLLPQAGGFPSRYNRPEDVQPHKNPPAPVHPRLREAI